MPPVSQPLCQEDVPPGWQGQEWGLAEGDIQPLAATKTAASQRKHKTPELVALCHPTVLTSLAGEWRKSIISECILQHIHIFKPFFFFSLCWKSNVPLCPLHSHTFSFQLNSLFFSTCSLWSQFGWLFSSSVYLLKTTCFSLCKSISLILYFTFETLRQHWKELCVVQYELRVITFISNLTAYHFQSKVTLLSHDLFCRIS